LEDEWREKVVELDVAKRNDGKLRKVRQAINDRL
jgi:hypothetical protein